MRLQSNPRRPASFPCPRCRQLISANSTRCIRCNLPQPGWIANFPVLDGLLREQIQFTNGIIAICFALFVGTLAMTVVGTLNSAAQPDLFGGGLLGMLNAGPSQTVLLTLGTNGWVSWESGQWWGILTATYLHANILHIAFNMLALVWFGPLVESEFGGSRFFILYTLSGIAGSLVTLAVGIPSSVGASGAIFGMLGALLYYGWRRGGTWGRGIFSRMLVTAVFNIGFGFINPAINNYAHIGGLVAGFVLAFGLGFNDRSKANFTHHLSALAVLAFVAVCFVSMFASVFTANL